MEEDNKNNVLHPLASIDMDNIAEIENKCKRIIDISEEGILELDDNIRVRYANKRAMEMLGVGPDEIIGRAFSDFMDSENQLKLEMFCERCKSGSVERHDLKLLRSNGQIMWVLQSFSPIMGGKFNGMISMMMDITERKKAEENLRESEEKYRLLAESFPEPIFIINASSDIEYINKKGRDVFKIKKGDNYLIRSSQLFSSEMFKKQNNEIEKVFKFGIESIYQMDFILDGRPVSLNYSLVPMLGKKSEVFSTIVIVRDITEVAELRKKVDDTIQ